MFRVLDKSYYFKNKEYVYPSKQYDCYRFIEDVKEYCKKIVLFGSSTTMHCRPDSDLDFAISVKDNSFMRYISEVTSNYKTGCDIVWLDNSKLSPLQKKSINEGVVIYG